MSTTTPADAHGGQRPDLLALAPDALAALSNRGLVKRAQRMLASGHGPVVQQAEDGTVSGHFERRDVVCRLPPGRPLAAADCDCGAVSVCYHTVATVMAFKARPPVGDAAGGSSVPAQDAVVAWSPGDFDDKEVATMVARLGMARARRLMAGGLVVTVSVDRSQGAAEPIARLPACTLRFLVPNDLSYARCDCEIAVGCEHLPIAIWAFREAGESALTEPVTVELAATGELDLAPTVAGRDVARNLLWNGIVGTADAFGIGYARAHAALLAANQVWPRTHLQELAEQFNAYRDRSARYRAAEAGKQVAGLEARWRVANNDTGAIPGAVVLGTTEAGDAKMDQVRLVSLGARNRALRGTNSTTDVYLVDLDTGNVSVLRGTYTGPVRGGGPSTFDLKGLATGQLVTQAARRQPNRQLIMVEQGGAKTSVTPKSADWSGVRAPVLVTDVSNYAERWATRSPTILRPRVLAENVVIVPVEEVCDVRWAPGEQALAATVVLPNGGGTIEIVRRFVSVAPGAIPHLARLLSGDDVTYLSGDMRRTSTGFVMDPLAVMTPTGIEVPDLAAIEPFQAALGEIGLEASALGTVLDEALAALDDGLHRGLLGASSGWISRLAMTGHALENHGLAHLASGLAACAESVERVRTGGRSADPDAPVRWMDAYIPLLLAREQVDQ